MRKVAALRYAGGLFLLVGLVCVSSSWAEEEDKKETVVNPAYKHWAAFKVGATVTRREKVKFHTDSVSAQQHHEKTLNRDTFVRQHLSGAKGAKRPMRSQPRELFPGSFAQCLVLCQPIYKIT